MNPKYRIEECYDFDEDQTYFLIQKLNMLNEWGYPNTPRYKTIYDAKRAVKIMKRYEGRVFHYVDDEE